MKYIDQFYCLAVKRMGRIDCKKRSKFHKKVCMPLITDKECRKCLEEEEGLADTFLDPFDNKGIRI